MNNINKEILFNKDLPREVKETALALISLKQNEPLMVTEPKILSLDIKWEKDEVSYIRFPKEIENDYRIYWSETTSKRFGKKLILIRAYEDITIQDLYILEVFYGTYKENKSIDLIASRKKLYHKNYISKIIDICK